MLERATGYHKDLQRVRKDFARDRKVPWKHLIPIKHAFDAYKRLAWFGQIGDNEL